MILSSAYKKLFNRCKDIVRQRISANQADDILGSVDEQQSMLDEFFAASIRDTDSFEHLEIFHAIRLSAFFAGVFSFLPSDETKSPNYEATWYHVHTFLFDTLDGSPANSISMDLLSTIEVMRGEICEVYRLIPFHRDFNRIPDECSLFFDALDIASELLSKHLQIQMTIRPSDQSREDFHTFRSKYSGATERYPIDIRTCVSNDIRRYFPGTPIQVPDRIIQAIRGTYLESIEQLVPEDNYLLSGLLCSIPSLAFALRASDFYPEKFLDEKASFSRTDTPSWGYAWTVSLSRMFFSSDGQPNEIAQRVLRSRTLGPFELIDGILDSMSRPWGHMNQIQFFQKLKSASPAWANGAISKDEVLNRIKEQSRIAQTIDPSFARQQLGLYVDDSDKVRVIQLAAWSLSSLSDSNTESQEYRLARGNIVQEIGPILREQIDEFEWLIEKEVPESEFQEFLERNPFILTSLGSYSRAEPHVILHEDAGRKLIPDFFLEFADRRDSDILELKLPDVTVDVRVTSRNRLSSKVHAAVAQLRTYRDWFKSESNRLKFIQATGMKCFMPRAIIVIGRSSDFKSDIDRINLEETLPNWASLRTYDDLLKSARNWESNLRLSG
jgi:Domain of unknown function (DUF4263)